ncbi:hypothetical protein [Psychrobacter sp. AOP31-B2-9]|uniref:hypothetical protein n=1 Tax=Psychrobacter sp. AOP31-B2-9 TaxID=3457693 RepID=UPI0040367EAE
MFKENKEDFRQWLIEEKGLSAKVTGDILSRCKRLDKCISQSIEEAVSSPQSYLIALKDIGTYATLNKQTAKSQYNLTATLRAAIRKYCEYRNPETFECYPSGNSLSR